MPPWLGPKPGKAWPPRNQPGNLFGGLAGNQTGLAFLMGVLLLAVPWFFGLPKLKAHREGRATFSPRTIRFGSTMLLTLACLVGAVWLSGCVGNGIYGTFEGTVTFNKLEYIDPELPATAPVAGGEPLAGLAWKLYEGQEVNKLDIFVEVTNSDAEEMRLVKFKSASSQSPLRQKASSGQQIWLNLIKVSDFSSQ